ncbi:conserved hypothetical protein [Alkaliphilus metalliredigens QYMF]|uniref:UPF0316 protein Amet_0954 n=1 Tax=Alkaliphilus metalliredigens (strain QYMF) TaxID=293826 RepID=Y954_ALKMQ|nr:DUF2179 domain-containing protein [Alkaliphilus metalliredigens]A6TLV6.1 RecName: Full=UPF0316 protein Amet_0954 [Alkaliphilus metalliredigens QYMF]ABR47174.1 conserved hypothetical protein [Alkaliphilus metalliredigens QYMF]
MELVLGYLFIFVARVTDVGMGTVRMIMVVKGKRIQAAAIGFVESIIYILAIGKVLEALDNPVNILVYATGFAAGNYVGIYIEERMALGNIIAQVMCDHNVMQLVDLLRDAGFGVTVVEGYGRTGIRHLLNVSLQRKNLSKLYNVLDTHDHKAFITVTDARSIRGGYFTSVKKK